VGSSSQQGQELPYKVHSNVPPKDQVLNSGLEKLRGSKFNTPEDLAAFSQRFDEGVKRVFSNDQGAQYIKFGSPRDNDHNCGIKAGRLTLTGYAHPLY
jgi:hypothetical protein